MKKANFRILTALALAALLMVGCTTPGRQAPGHGKLGMELYESYLEKADVDYAYEVAMKLVETPEFFTSPLGGRNAGSDAEHLTAQFLKGEMERIGLKNVTLDAFPVDTWQFNGAELEVLDAAGEKRVLHPYSYAAGTTAPDGITAELLYLGDGTMYDYDGVDAEGKIILVDIDQRANWWVTYPTLEAHFQGAAAIINSNVGGFAQLNEDTMNCQDMCGPAFIPSLNISQNDAAYLKGLLAEGPVTVKLTVDNIVEEGGTSYNVVGSIPGRNPDEMVAVGTHYDVHFTGFQDNTIAVGLTLAIAKGLIDSGYQPERTLVFILHGAEEWGAIDSYYDWSIGAWNQVNRVRPDWVGKTLAYINFELPAVEFSDTVRTDTPPELFTMMKKFVAGGAPEPVDCYPGGVITEGYAQYTYSDDFSYTKAGIPAMVNGFLLTPDGEDVWPFYYTTYHTNFDLPDTYNEAVLDFNLRFYGSLAMAFDQTPALELDFQAQYERISDAVDEELCRDAGADYDAFLIALEGMGAAAGKAHARVSALNEEYARMLAYDDSPEARESFWARGQKITAAQLEAFRVAQEKFLRLSLESPIVGPEFFQENISLLTASVEELKNGNVDYVIDELLWQVNGIEEWYNYYFSRETIDYLNNQVHGPENAGNQFWGTGMRLPAVSLYDVTQSLMEAYGSEGVSFADEIAVMEGEIASQKAELKSYLAGLTRDLREFTGFLEEIR